MKKTLFIIVFIIISCKGDKKEDKLKIIENNKDSEVTINDSTFENFKIIKNEIDKVKPNLIKEKFAVIDSKTIDTLYVGVEFYNVDAFKDYEFVEMEPYEEFMTDDKNNMFHIMIYKKGNHKYALFAVLEKNIGLGELSPIWKKTKKKVVDIIRYSTDYNSCWYHVYTPKFSPENYDIINDYIFVIANMENIYLENNSYREEELNRLVKKQGFRIWKVDIIKNIFVEIKKQEILNGIDCF